MRITLIAPPLMDYMNGVLRPISMDAVRTCPPYGIYLLASVLGREGHTVTIIDLIAQGSRDLSAHLGTILSSHLIGIGSSSLSWPTAKACIDDIRKFSRDIPVVLGGIHATMFDRYVLSTTGANFVIRGEAEAALPRLCRALESGGSPEDIPGLTYKRISGKIVRNPAAPKLSAGEIAKFPLPDYSQIPPGVYTGLGIESSRGCPFDCIFCSTSYRRSWRGLSPRDFVDRVEQILPHRPRTTHGFIQIIDDEFTVQTKRAIDICHEFKNRGLRLDIVFDARANDLLKEDFVAAVLPYAQQFLVGAECGYDEGLRKIGKKTSTAMLVEAARILKKSGLASKADFSFVIGLPWETKAEVLKTVRFGFDLYSRFGVRVLLQWYCQIPGSRLWEEQHRKEVLHEAQYDDYGFFRDNYLFRTGVQLTPSEVYEVSGIVGALKSLSVKSAQGQEMFQSSTPDPILHFHPVNPGVSRESSLANLREVAGVV